MSEIAIGAEGLAKQYQIGERERYRALRDVIASVAGSPVRRIRAMLRGREKGNQIGKGGGTIWALQDVSLDIKRGEVVGVIGRNGAGKSTLLKILSRITEPTRGRAEIHGRVGSLLEVGTGFHPELTGRDNIFLNGAILGMKKSEICRKFDEIVAFSEVEQFIDTPVKRYSSGMYVRLAFAVAAHMETEILIVDEVLAVGDTQFQKKCLGKMGDVARHGRTVLLVSHNMAAVHSLCSRAILLEHGRSMKEGDPVEVTRSYLNGFEKQANGATVDLRSPAVPRSGKVNIFCSLRLKNGAGAPTVAYLAGDDMTIELDLDPPFAIPNPIFFVGVDDSIGRRIFTASSQYSQSEFPVLDRPTTVACTLPDLSLFPGRYWLSICVGTAYDWSLDLLVNIASFDVHASDYFGTGRMPTQELGAVLKRSQWQISNGVTEP
jgi:lipopolysaccharide transport system ATP-binding protein